MVKKFLKKIRQHFKEVLRIKNSPEEIASGFAIGTFIAIFPTFGLAPFIGLFIILIFKKISKIALFLALLIWNPFVLIPIYTLGFKVGDFFLAEQPIITFKIQILDVSYALIRRTFVGNFILAVIISILSFVIIYISSLIYQRIKNKK